MYVRRPQFLGIHLSDIQFIQILCCMKMVGFSWSIEVPFVYMADFWHILNMFNVYRLFDIQLSQLHFDIIHVILLDKCMNRKHPAKRHWTCGFFPSMIWPFEYGRWAQCNHHHRAAVVVVSIAILRSSVEAILASISLAIDSFHSQFRIQWR